MRFNRYLQHLLTALSFTIVLNGLALCFYIAVDLYPKTTFTITLILTFLIVLYICIAED